MNPNQPATPAGELPPASPRFPVVAIGASAGGLDALERLFAALPTDTGAAFVVIQHLSPDHKSMMTSLLSRHTAMPVGLVADDTLLEPNRVYLIPPGSVMHLDGYRLRLTPKSPHTFTLPVDVFFQSLAMHIGEPAVAVVLSGTGSDGTRGASAVHAAGGLVLAQDPEDAKFDGMPRSVIAAGLVDAVLSAEDLSSRIATHAHDPVPTALRPLRTPAARALGMGPEAAMANILQLLLELGGINFEEYKPATVVRRIERRMAVHQLDAFEAYADLLTRNRAEVLTLRRELLIPVTGFFRDEASFEVLRKLVVEPLVANKAPEEDIRVWCAGVATGEEAYSVAMLFIEAFEALGRWPALKVFATDVEQSHVEKAGAGSYPESIGTELSPQRLDRFFVHKGHQVDVKSELRQCIVFARHNLLSDPPFTRMDLVVCRNTLIYFRAAAQERALRRLQYALGPRGHLFLGSSESLGPASADFHAVSALHKIWQVVRPTVLPLPSNRPHSKMPGMPARTVSLARPAASPGMGVGSVDLGFSALLKAYTPPPAVLINGSHELLHVYGDVERYLHIQPGHASLDLNRVLPDVLVPVATAVLFKAAREHTHASSGLVRLTPDANLGPGHASTAEQVSVRLCAWPLGEADGQRLFLLVFEPPEAAHRDEPPYTVEVVPAATEHIEALELELAATRESLQATIQELESANEEMHASNEEMLASNEELQSSNEELQSLNEELNTVNAEYQEKIDILHRLNADLDNLAHVSPSATVFVDEHLQLTRFNPEAAQIFRVRPSDIGRPLADLTHTLAYTTLAEDLRNTLATGNRLETEVVTQPRAGGEPKRHLLLKMRPYQVPSSASRGVVISLTDVSAMVELSRLQRILDALGEHVAVLDETGTITLVNRAWRMFAQDNGDPALLHSGVGVNYLRACDPKPGSQPDGDAADAAAGLRAVLSGQQPAFALEYPCHSPTEQRWFVMHAQALAGAGTLPGDPGGAVVSHVNITAWRKNRASALTDER